ncbi:MAG: phosphate ABC transporter ATP-binding protein [Acidobacteriaceae bacterium]|nr:phosphate ABC transporter ATP-binding protein [Acidobacteriaceae bacterium]
MLEARKLSRIVNGVALVQDVSFRVVAGEVMAIVGPSGAGKSSLVRLLNRRDEPSSGTVYLQGTDYRGLPPRELRRRVGMVTQRAFLFPGTVAENIRFGPLQRGERPIDSTVDSMLARVGLPGYAPRDVANLSGGEAQRVSIARALANAPAVLLMDEPTSALDDDAKLGIESLIRNIITDANLTCLIVTHDIPQATRLAGGVLVLESGRVVNSGPVESVFHA